VIVANLKEPHPLTSWPEVKVPVRGIRSLETYSVRRQLDKKVEIRFSDWMWVTTLPSAQLPVQRAVTFGHQRWDIENHGFNELVEGGHTDHVLKHDAAAIECFLLMAFLAFILFTCLSVSQREAIPSQRQVQRLLGENHGTRNLPIANPTLPISLIRRHPPFVLNRFPPQIPNSSSGTGTGAVVCAIA
jgi:hypothetical protein